MNPETVLQNKIIVELNKRGHYISNHTVGVFYTKYGGVVKVGTPGEADLWGHTKTGKALYIEVKLPGQKPRQNQLDFIDAMNKGNAVAGWVTTVEDAVRLADEHCN